MWGTLREIPFCRDLDNIVNFLKSKNEGGVEILNVYGSFLPFFIADLLRKTPTFKYILITQEEEKIEEYTEGIKFFLRGFGINKEVLKIPHSEWNIFQDIQVSKSIEIEQLATLCSLITGQDFACIVTSYQGLMELQPPEEFLKEKIKEIRQGETLLRDEFINYLIQIGYSHEEVVENVSEFAIRGGIIDCYSPLYPKPLRILLCEDYVENIYFFNPETQFREEKIENAFIFPVSKIIYNQKNIITILKRLNDLGKKRGCPERILRKFEDEIKRGNLPFFHRRLIPLFWGSMSTIFEYLTKDIIYIYDNEQRGMEKIEEVWKKSLTLYNELKEQKRLTEEIEKLLLKPSEIRKRIQGKKYLSIIPFENFSRKEETISIKWNKIKPFDENEKEYLKLEGRERIVSIMRSLIKEGYKIFIVCEKEEEKKKIRDFLINRGLNTSEVRDFSPVACSSRLEKIYLINGRWKGEFRFDLYMCVFFDSSLILGKVIKRLSQKKSLPRGFLEYFKEMKVGDLVVHIDHGIGIYKGIHNLSIEGICKDCFLIEYKNGDKLYTPMEYLNKIQRYIHEGGEHPPLDKLGGNLWERKKKRVKEDVKKVAEKLLRLYALREKIEGHGFLPPNNYYKEFEDKCPFELTEDQKKAIEDVIEDMMKPKPMDRLICGDVGFGKTEVAMRASFIAVMEGFQVALLVPTTLLAEQHFVTFNERFKDFPVIIESLTRFKTTGEKKIILSKLKQGVIDIIIGTHALLQKDVEFKNLGLLIIDEEHFFGVEQKEKLKELKKNVDCLTLSATPIPRTIHMALSGIREMSIIATPPKERYPIKTHIIRFDKNILRENILEEIERGGQVFFVHNRVQTIYKIAGFLSQLIPEKRVGVAHAQMKNTELEDVMISFLHREISVLVCTSIIEAGIDIGNANTIFIDMAENMGLSQLYQLRGRVGRRNIPAKAFLIIPPLGKMTSDAEKRIYAFQRFIELGSGFSLSLFDMEIRGAGNVIGVEQKGHMRKVGYEMYLELLEEVLRELRGEKNEIEIPEPEIKIPVVSYIPEYYISEQSLRLLFYKRIANVKNYDELKDIEKEMEDRFGNLPQEVKNLLNIISIRELARKKDIVKVLYKNEELSLYPFQKKGKKLKKPKGEPIFRWIENTLTNLI